MVDHWTRFNELKLFKGKVPLLLWRSWWLSAWTLWWNRKHETKDSAYEVSRRGPWRGARQRRWPPNERGNGKRRWTSPYGKRRHAWTIILIEVLVDLQSEGLYCSVCSKQFVKWTVENRCFSGLRKFSFWKVSALHRTNNFDFSYPRWLMHNLLWFILSCARWVVHLLARV